MDRNGKMRVQVHVRVAPYMEDGLNFSNVFVTDPDDPHSASIMDPFSDDVVEHTFKFDKIYNDLETQDSVWQSSVAPIVNHVAKGGLGTVLAYGHTGSGKSHTIFGQSLEAGREGALPRALKSLLSVCKEKQNQKLLLSVIEIHDGQYRDLGKAYPYKKQLYALLRSRRRGVTPTTPILTQTRTPLTDLELSRDASGLGIPKDLFSFFFPSLSSTSSENHNTSNSNYKPPAMTQIPSAESVHSVLLTNAEEFEVTSESAGLDFLGAAMALRSVEENLPNSKGKLAHTLAFLRLVPTENKKLITNNKSTKPNALIDRGGLLCIGDLAGSERSPADIDVKDLPKYIKKNEDLSSMGKVLLQIIKDPFAVMLNTGAHLSFRDNTLTRALQSSLYGDGACVLIGCISSDPNMYEESRNTLIFADRVRDKTVPDVIVSSDGSEALQKRNSHALVSQLETLKAAVASQESSMRKLEKELSGSFVNASTPDGLKSPSHIKNGKRSGSRHLSSNAGDVNYQMANASPSNISHGSNYPSADRAGRMEIITGAEGQPIMQKRVFSNEPGYSKNQNELSAEKDYANYGPKSKNVKSASGHSLITRSPLDGHLLNPSVEEDLCLMNDKYFLGGGAAPRGLESLAGPNVIDVLSSYDKQQKEAKIKADQERFAFAKAGDDVSNALLNQASNAATGESGHEVLNKALFNLHPASVISNPSRIADLLGFVLTNSEARLGSLAFSFAQDDIEKLEKGLERLAGKSVEELMATREILERDVIWFNHQRDTARGEVRSEVARAAEAQAELQNARSGGSAQEESGQHAWHEARTRALRASQQLKDCKLRANQQDEIEEDSRKFRNQTINDQVESIGKAMEEMILNDVPEFLKPLKSVSDSRLLLIQDRQTEILEKNFDTRMQRISDSRIEILGDIDDACESQILKMDRTLAAAQVQLDVWKQSFTEENYVLKSQLRQIAFLSACLRQVVEDLESGAVPLGLKILPTVAPQVAFPKSWLPSHFDRKPWASSGNKPLPDHVIAQEKLRPGSSRRVGNQAVGASRHQVQQTGILPDEKYVDDCVGPHDNVLGKNGLIIRSSSDTSNPATFKNKSDQISPFVNEGLNNKIKVNNKGSDFIKYTKGLNNSIDSSLHPIPVGIAPEVFSSSLNNSAPSPQPPTAALQPSNVPIAIPSDHPSRRSKTATHVQPVHAFGEFGTDRMNTGAGASLGPSKSSVSERSRAIAQRETMETIMKNSGPFEVLLPALFAEYNKLTGLAKKIANYFFETRRVNIYHSLGLETPQKVKIAGENYHFTHISNLNALQKIASTSASGFLQENPIHPHQIPRTGMTLKQNLALEQVRLNIGRGLQQSGLPCESHNKSHNSLVIPASQNDTQAMVRAVAPPINPPSVNVKPFLGNSSEGVPHPLPTAKDLVGCLSSGISKSVSSLSISCACGAADCHKCSSFSPLTSVRHVGGSVEFSNEGSVEGGRQILFSPLRRSDAVGIGGGCSNELFGNGTIASWRQHIDPTRNSNAFPRRLNAGDSKQIYSDCEEFYQAGQKNVDAKTAKDLLRLPMKQATNVVCTLNKNEAVAIITSFIKTRLHQELNALCEAKDSLLLSGNPILSELGIGDECDDELGKNSFSATPRANKSKSSVMSLLTQSEAGVVNHLAQHPTVQKIFHLEGESLRLEKELTNLEFKLKSSVSALNLTVRKASLQKTVMNSITTNAGGRHLSSANSSSSSSNISSHFGKVKESFSEESRPHSRV